MSGNKKCKTSMWDVLLVMIIILIVVLDLMRITGFDIKGMRCDSWSMFPNLYCGCFYMTQSISYPGQVKENDVVIFRKFKNGQIYGVIHRVKEWNNFYLVTQGDNNGMEDATLSWEQVTHKYVNGYCFLPSEMFVEEVDAWKRAQH